MTDPPPIRLGTSAFTMPGWNVAFYPEGMKQSDYLTFYAEHFDTVEIDSTFYRTPSPQTVNGWALKTPQEFIFSVKIPQIITHEKVPVDCDHEFEEFMDVIEILQEKLGVTLFQFPYFDRTTFARLDDFLAVLAPFMEKLPKIGGYRFAIEIRNKKWLEPKFADLLREHGVALVLQDLKWMPSPAELMKSFDPITADFTYVRWLGDRKKIESITKIWDKEVVDKTNLLSGWVDVIHAAADRGVTAFCYANNHYEGYAPATIEKFRNLWYAKGLPELGRATRMRQEDSLFD